MVDDARRIDTDLRFAPGDVDVSFPGHHGQR